MSDPLFGTDGIRGRANSEPMTAITALKVAMAAAAHFTVSARRHIALIGKDTRLSGYMIEPAMVAGLVSAGMDVVLVGPLPTPAIATLTRLMRADLGIMISASHNPYEDNGIKLFGPDGYKLSDEVEAKIAAGIANDAVPFLASADRLGRARRLDDAPGRYIEMVKMTFPKGLRLGGLKIAIDCANGAAYKVAPTVLWELGADIVPLGVAPDGKNINRECGATAVDMLAAQTVLHGCDLGIALDGDADRVILIDEHGSVIDGDQIMALIATNLAVKHQLKHNTVVATIMSNLGFERHLSGHGLTLCRTRVGDRYVVEAMRAGGFNLGGEQSGHIILSDYSTTGDGLIAALQFLACLVNSDNPASEIAHVFAPLPQRLINVHLPQSVEKPLDQPSVQSAIAAAERELGATGRLVIRKSGTEPVIRVMVEAEDDSMVNRILGELQNVIEHAV